MSVLNQTTLWILLIILVLVALASALLFIAALTHQKDTKSILVPFAVFLLSLGGILLVNLATSTN